MKSLIKSGSLLLITAFAAIIPFQSAHSDQVSAAMRFNIGVAPTCALDYYRNANLHISSRTLHQLVAGNNSGRINHGSVRANIDFRSSNDLNINPQLANSLHNLPVRLRNAFAARCISRNGYMRVSSQLLQNTGRRGPRSWIRASNLRIRENSGGPTGASLVVPATGLNPNNAFMGAMGFNMDLRNARRAGPHFGIVAGLRVTSL